MIADTASMPGTSPLCRGTMAGTQNRERPRTVAHGRGQAHPATDEENPVDITSVPTPVAAEHYRAIWPVLTRHTLDELVAEARPHLSGLLLRGRVKPVARPRWSIRPGADIAGSGGAHEVLVCDVPVVQVPRPAA